MVCRAIAKRLSFIIVKTRRKCLSSIDQTNIYLHIMNSKHVLPQLRVSGDSLATEQAYQYLCEFFVLIYQLLVAVLWWLN